MNASLELLAVTAVQVKWPFVVTVGSMAAALPPLLRHYRSREWSIPFWHGLVAIAVLYIAGYFAHDYYRTSVWVDRWQNGASASASQRIAVETAIELAPPATLSALLCSGVSYWLIRRRKRQS